jgi:hypothetical protein
MNANKRQSAVMGIFLIAVGLVWWLNLWWLLLPGALVIAGAMGYLQRRAAGRMAEGMQAALWGVGLGLLFLIGFVWPGILFLAGASVLLNGREAQVESYAQSALSRVRRQGRRSSHTEQVPVETVPSLIVPISQAGVSSSDTTRMRD